MSVPRKPLEDGDDGSGNRYPVREPYDNGYEARAAELWQNHANHGHFSGKFYVACPGCKNDYPSILNGNYYTSNESYENETDVDGLAHEENA